MGNFLLWNSIGDLKPDYFIPLASGFRIRNTATKIFVNFVLVSGYTLHEWNNPYSRKFAEKHLIDHRKISRVLIKMNYIFFLLSNTHQIDDIAVLIFHLFPG